MTLNPRFLTAMRETVTIMRPMPSSYPRGKGAMLKTAPKTSIRMHAEDEERIKEAASLCGVTVSQFIRWLAVNGAVDILKQYAEFTKK